VLRWTFWDNHKLTGTVAPLRYLMKFVPEEKTDQHVITWLGKRSAIALKVLDRHLFTREWVAADHITTADLSCVGYLYYDHEFGHDLTAYPNIERWRQAIAALPGWKHPYDLMPGHPIPADAFT
jgi:glutathione S-transferase